MPHLELVDVNFKRHAGGIPAIYLDSHKAGEDEITLSHLTNDHL